ncbi:hypothetical protein OROMI_032537 [Orobanche minor]
MLPVPTLFGNHLPPKPSPCLMLPIASRGGDLVYSVYSPAEDRILTFSGRGRGATTGNRRLVDDNAVVVGSGHGWLATFNASGNHDLFLSHPISGQHIKLPPMIFTPFGFFLGPANKLWNVKIIISSSPGTEECRVVMSIYGLGLTGLAYCIPGRSTEWVPLCGLQETATNFVYSKRQHCFICVSTPRIAIGSWDLRHHQPPRMVNCFKKEIKFVYKNCPLSREEIGRHEEVHYVVLEEESDDLYIVRRFVDYCTDFDGSYKTFDFLVFKVDRKRRKAIYTSAGPTMFLGTDQSFALSSSAEFPLIKPNSIYFTNPTHCLPENGHAFIDIGIYDYKERTMTHHHCPFDVEGVPVGHVPGPLWFSPSNP